MRSESFYKIYCHIVLYCSNAYREFQANPTFVLTYLLALLYAECFQES